MAGKTERIDTNEAQRMLEEQLNIYVARPTFLGWVRTWAKARPDMVFQPVPRGRFYIEKTKYKEFLNDQAQGSRPQIG